MKARAGVSVVGDPALAQELSKNSANRRAAQAVATLVKQQR
jgi:hypothetical protein